MSILMVNKSKIIEERALNGDHCETEGTMN